MRGSLNRSLSIAAAVAIAATMSLAAISWLALVRADGLLDRVARSQAQLALANRIEADATGLMIAVPALRREAAASLTRDIRVYRASIADETARLPAGERSRQAPESDRARTLQRIATRLIGGERPAFEELVLFRSVVAAIVRGEAAEARRALARMQRLRAGATLLAVALPLLLLLLALWFLAAMRRGVSAPLAALGRAADRIGAGDVSPALAGFSDFAPLARAVADADREIHRQRLALEQANRSLERQVEERTATLARQNARLAEIDGTRRLFFSQVGHELRTPVTVMRGEAEVALREPAAAPERLREALDHIVATGAFLGRRIDDLLTVAQSEDGRLTITPRATDLAAIARAVQRIAGGYAASVGATLTLDVHPESVPVAGDPSWLQQALLALVDNAVKHGGGERIAITVRLVDGAAVATVADDGRGVPAEALPRLFDAWFSPANSTRGAGLGLAVARWVAEAHGGTIAAENGVEGGLIVTLRVPAA